MDIRLVPPWVHVDFSSIHYGSTRVHPASGRAENTNDDFIAFDCIPGKKAEVVNTGERTQLEKVIWRRNPNGSMPLKEPPNSSVGRVPAMWSGGIRELGIAGSWDRARSRTGSRCRAELELEESSNWETG